MRLNAAAEAVGFGKTNYPPQYRGNLRLLATDPGLAAKLWERLRPLVPGTIEVVDGLGGHLQQRHATWEACGLNEMFRLAKYYPGHRFGAHHDANYVANKDMQTLYTVNVYTNTVAPGCGGRTRFYAEAANNKRKPHAKDCDLQVRPEAGLAVCFLQPPADLLLHDGEELTGGLKYLLRTDVMYRRVPE